MPSTIWSGKPRGPYPWNQRTEKQRAEDYLLARFQTEAERQEAARERYFKSVFVREKFFRLTKRKKAYDEYHRKIHAKRLKDEYASAIHEALRASWRHMADTDEFTYQYPIEKKNTRISKKNREEWLETQKELDIWDLKHEHTDEELESPKAKGKVTKGGKDKKAPPGPAPKPKDVKSGNKLLKKVIEKVEVDESQLPDPLLWGKEALAYMQDVKVRILKELREKFEAQQRERMERIEKEKAEVLLKEGMEEQAIQDLQRQKEEEQEALRRQEAQRIADEEEQQKRDYRMEMAVALMTERQAEWDVVTSRDHELLSMMREDCLDEVYQEWLLWEALRKKKEEDRKAKRWNLCTEIMLQIVTMMDIRIDYKAEFNSETPATNWRGWKTLFVQGVILPCPIFGNVMPAEQSTVDPNTIFAKAVVDDYLEEQGEWQGAHVIGKNNELGLILAEVHDVADSPPEPPPLPNLTQFKLKIAVVGTPFAGKSTVAKKLEHDFDCVRIEIQNVVNSAVALAEVEEKIHKAKLAEEEKKRGEAEAQRILEEKQKLEYDQQQEALGLKDIYLRSKSRIEVGSPPSENVEPDTKAEPTSEKGKESKSGSKTEKGKEGKASSKDDKDKADLKESKKQKKGGEKQKSDKGKKKEKIQPTEALQEPQPEPTPEPPPFGPPPEPPNPLAYLTPFARAGMEIKLAQAEGLPAPGNSLADLVLLTLSNLQEYADAHPAEAEVPQKGDLRKGGKGGPTAKKKQAASKKDAPTAQGKKSPSSSPRGKANSEWDDPSDKVLGFVLDGFPTNLGEVKALEWKLSGIDLDYIYNHHAKTSRIAPRPELVVKLKSGFDGYLQLQALDENECFKRAMGKVMDDKTGKIYHLDYDPPPSVKTNPKEKGLVQRLVPVEDLEVVRPKIIAGLKAWPYMTQYLQNILNVFPIAQQEQNGKTTVDTLQPCTLATKFLDGWSKTQAAKVAAQAGLEAQSVASQALENANNASKLANEVAHKLWCTKLAEVETEQGLDALGGDTLAKQLVKEKISVTVTRRLDEVCKAAKEAEGAAEAARMASLLAEQRANLAKDNVDGADLEFSFHLKAEAEEAAEVAKQAAIRADEAHKKAILAFEAATAALLPKPDVTFDDEKKGSKKDKFDPKNAKGAKEGKGAKDQKDPTDSKDLKSSMKNSKGGIGENDTSDEKAKFPSTDPGSPLLVGAAPSTLPTALEESVINKELAVSIHGKWEGVEANYLTQLEAIFNTMHKEKAITRNHVVQMINRFISFLQSRDERQQTFDDFQEKWNRIETPQRLDRKFKPKLVTEVSKLDKTLNDICARREKRCIELSEEGLVDLLESRIASLIRLFTRLVQTELDRHLQSCNLLKEYYSKTLGFDLLAFSCSLAEVATEPSEKFPLPGWMVTLAAPMPKLHKVFMKATSVAYSVLDVIAGKVLEKSDKKGKKGSEKKKNKPEKKEKEKKGGKGSKDKTQAGGEVTTPIVDTLPPPLGPSIPPATSREHEIFLHRLQRIAKVALSYYDELQPIVDGAFKRMKEWSTPRLKAEAEVVHEVLSLCTEAAEEQIPLWYRVYLDGDVFHVDESQLVLECPIKEATNLNLWSCKVLENLLTDFKAISPRANYMMAGLARATVTGAIVKTHTLFKNDLKESLLPRLPASKRDPHGPFQAWQELADQMFKEVIGDPTKDAKFVDWRGLLIALVDARFSHIISHASCEDILNARKALFPVATLDKEGVLKSPDTHGYLLLEDLLGIKFWFDPSAPKAPGEFDYGLALKIFLYNLLDEGPKGIQYQKLLLYICRDPNQKQALEKAFYVAAESGTLASEEHLTPETVLGILYPWGVEAAWSQAIVPFIIDDLHNLLWYVAKEKWDKAERERESDLAGSEESGSNEDIKPCIKDLEIKSTSTDSDHATIVDFLEFAYTEFGELSQAETVKDFLCSLDVNKDTCSHVPDPDPGPYKCDVHVTVPVVQEAEVEEADPYAIPETYTVQDILKTTATKNLSDVLFGNYGSDRVQLFDQVTIEDDNEQETPPEEEENGKKKSKDKEKKEKKEKREKKEKEKKEKKGKKEKEKEKEKKE